MQEIKETSNAMTKTLLTDTLSRIAEEYKRFPTVWVIISVKPDQSDTRVIRQGLVVTNQEPPCPLLGTLCFRIDTSTHDVYTVWMLDNVSEQEMFKNEIFGFNKNPLFVESKKKLCAAMNNASPA